MKPDDDPLQRLSGVIATNGGEGMAEVLRRAVVNGTLPPGTRLRQAELAEMFGVSRTPAREALHKLNAWGMVDMVVNQAAVVTAADRSHYADAFVVWAELEALAVELAAPHALPVGSALVAAVRDEASVVESVVDCARGGSPRAARERWGKAHAAFHQAILTASGSGRLRETVEATTARLTRQALWDGLEGRPYPLRRALRQHEEIADLIVAGRTDAACERMQAHILGLGDAFLQNWQRNESAAGAAG